MICLGNVLAKFKERVSQIPEATAIIYEGQKMTYKQLDELSSKLANYLYKNNYSENTFIPIYMPPCPEMIVSILGVLKVGAAYLPISTEYPVLRINMLLEDSNSKIILKNTNDLLNVNVKQIHVRNIITSDYSDSFDEKKGEFAYLMYTSGSTGKPKGVKVTHSNLEYILNNMQKYYPISRSDKYILSTPFTFDVSVVEIFGWIYGGGALVIPTQENSRNFRKLAHLIEVHKVTHIALSPAILNLMLDKLNEDDIDKLDRNLKYLMVAGEEFKASLAHKAIKYLKNVCIENLYGPTECTVYATRYRIDHDFNRSTVPIGKELDGVQIKILDSNGIEVPIGVQGEMYISGNGVAEGYLNLPTINNEKFLFIDGEKYYKTGDYAKRLKDGNIEFIGRKDYQVQINGIRVELGEIEDIILKEIKEINMVKVLYENNKLYCFYQAKKAIVPDDIKKILKNFLPSYMIPNFYKQIDEFPLTINRKIDTKALMSYHDDADMIHNVIQNDVSDTQQKILSIFRETLHVDSISLYDSFFDLGGDSLDVISVIIELENYYNINLDESVLYNHQNVSELAGYIEKRLEQENEVTKQFQKTAEDINIDHIKSQISSSYYKNNKSIGTIEKVYPVYYHQKNYIKDNFNSAIDIKIDVKKDFQLERVIQACKDIILSNELLRSVISLESEQVVFKQVKLDMDSYEIPLFDLSEYSYDSATLLVDEMTKTMAEVVLKSPLDELLYTVAIFELQQKYIVVFVLSHNIADLSNKHILIKQFMDLLNGHKLGNRLEYKDFIDFMESKNKLAYISNCDYTKKLLKVNDNRVKVQSSDDLLLLKFHFDNKLRTTFDIIDKMNYISTQILSRVIGQKEFIYQTIVNIRKYKDLDFSNCIGDYHTSMVLLGKPEETFEEFKDRMEEVYSMYRDGFNPIYLFAKGFPNMSETHKDLYRLYGVNPIAKTNYLGTIKNEQLNVMFDSLEETRKNLSTLRDNPFFITSFSTKDYIYIAFLNKPANLDEKIYKDLDVCEERIFTSTLDQ